MKNYLVTINWWDSGHNKKESFICDFPESISDLSIGDIKSYIRKAYPDGLDYWVDFCIDFMMEMK